MENKHQTARTIMAIVAVILGLYFVFLAPAQLDNTQFTLMWKQTKQGANFGAGPVSRLWIGMMLRGALIMAGLALIAVAHELYKGTKWAHPFALTMAAVAPIGAFFIGLGYLENIGGLPPAWIVFFVGLIGFWAILLLKPAEKQVKIAQFVVITLVGMLGAQAFTLAPHTYRIVAKDFGVALSDPTVNILLHSGPIMLILIFLTWFAIPQLAAGKEKGWWMALIAGLSMAVAGFPVHALRPTASLVPEGTLAASPFTSTYFMAAAQGVILVIILLIPYFKKQFTK
jgi:hypothetical protein